MSGLNVSQLEGLITLTLEKYGKGKVTDIAANIQDYVVMSKLLPKYKESLDGGKSFKFNLATAYGDNSRHTGLFAVDNVDVTDAVTPLFDAVEICSDESIEVSSLPLTSTNGILEKMLL